MTTHTAQAAVGLPVGERSSAAASSSRWMFDVAVVSAFVLIQTCWIATLADLAWGVL